MIERTKFLTSVVSGLISNPVLGALDQSTRRPNRVDFRGLPESSLTSPASASVLVLEHASELRPYLTEWEELAATSIEPNPFYEPWMLTPAIEALSGDGDLKFALVFAKPDICSPPMLSGFFPLERRSRYKGLPVGVSSLWKHIHCFLCMPLVSRLHARETLHAFFDWAESASSPNGLLELPHIPAEGPFAKLLLQVMDERVARPLQMEQFSRGFADVRGNFDTYLAQAISPKGRRELRRRERLLSTQGRLEYRVLKPDEDVATWIEAFFKLESSGWKGRGGTAIACDEAERRFVASALRAAFDHGRLLMVSLNLEDSPIAIQCNLLSGRGCFAFKTAYDERYSHCSPGFLLQIRTVHELHGMPSIDWMDSCAAPDSTAVNRVCADRRKLQTVLLATGGPASRMLISSIPLIKGLKQRLIHRPMTAIPPIPGDNAELVRRGNRPGEVEK
ncbi:MAG TPA: GNAT family N-acetyltransferase [Blastocatellia bacterium]|nr:GNAT family N-acetyltransferase [Blastocatellia bacterium]